MSDPALEGARAIARINAFFPILPMLGNRWAATRPWEGKTVALNLHITSLTAALVRELRLGGGTWIVSAANPATTHASAVAHLRDMGVEVHTGGALDDHLDSVIDASPSIVADVGFDLMQRMIDRSVAVEAAVVVSRSAIQAMRQGPEVPFPVVNILEGRLKNAVENRHGVGDGVWRAVGALTGMHLAGRRLLVIGYGPVGRGLATYARAANMSVEVVEADPVRRLFAHYDGYPTTELDEAIQRAGIIVTATGRTGALSIDDLGKAQDGVVVLNAGHGDDEIDVAGLAGVADAVDQIADKVVRYTLPDGPTITLLAGGTR